MSEQNLPLSATERTQRYYFAAWRWHFYAGLFVIPFLIMLTVTGLIMMVSAQQFNQMGLVGDVAVTGEPLPISNQAKQALAAVPNGKLDRYVAPEAIDRPAFFAVKQGKTVMNVAVDPYNGDVLNVVDKTQTLYAITNDIHGELLIGDFGDWMVEAASSMTILLIVTGLYLWLSKMGWKSFIPDLQAKGRAVWKSWHGVVGTWISLFLLLFVLSGLAWAGVWGGKFVQPWSSFPVERKAKMWSSDVTHASLNHGPLDEVPWGLELTPMPISGTTEGAPGVPKPVALDSVVQWAAVNGFTGQYKVTLPRGEKGVYTISVDGRNEDSVSPEKDRTLHIDQYSGNVLADIRYDDYPLLAKTMAWGIGLHKGMAGTWNFILNLVLLSMILVTCISGIVMWWKRRPSGAGRLVAPPLPQDMPLWKGAFLVALAISMAFPLGGLTLLAVIALDLLIVTRIPALKKAFS